MESIYWEQDISGFNATYKPVSRKYISPPAAQHLVKRLMVDVSTLSAEFGSYGLIVFTRLMGISVFDDKGGEFYGLYSSNALGEEEAGVPIYCLRKSAWNKSFKDLDAVLSGLKGSSVFFGLDHLNAEVRDSILQIDGPIGEKLNISYLSDNEAKMSGKTVSYFALDHLVVMQGEYQLESASIPHVEKTFHLFSSAFAEVSTRGGIIPDSGSFRVSYTSDIFDFMRR